MRTPSSALCTGDYPRYGPQATHTKRGVPWPSHKRHARPLHPALESSSPPGGLTKIRTPKIFQRLPGLTRSKSPPIKLSRPLHAKLQRALEHGWCSSTLNNYGYAVDRFLRFCDTEQVPPSLRLPADKFVLCAFAASSAGVHAGSTAHNNIAALKAWHIAQHQPWNGSARLQYIISGVEQLAPKLSKRGPRPPISSAMLRLLYDGLDFRNPEDVAVFAAASVAFWGQCRLGELLPTSQTDTTYLPTRGDVSRSKRNPSTLVLHLPRTKMKVSGEDVMLVAQDAPLDPQVALYAHLSASKLPAMAPLFAYISNAGITNLTRSKFLERCNIIWSSAGYPRTTGHSFRIGGTTELLLAGVSPDVVKAQGRWSSDAFLRYWRSLEDLAPLHASKVRTTRAVHHLGYTPNPPSALIHNGALRRVRAE